MKYLNIIKTNENTENFLLELLEVSELHCCKLADPLGIHRASALHCPLSWIPSSCTHVDQQLFFSMKEKDDQVIRKRDRNFGGSIFNCWTFPTLCREGLWDLFQADERSSCLHSKLDGKGPALKWKVAWICIMAVAESLDLEPSVFFCNAAINNINSETNQQSYSS